jgi:hypothetical protein
MSPAVEKKLLSVLDPSTETVLDEKTYDTVFDQLLYGKDDASIEARVALMDYPIAAAHSELLSCASYPLAARELCTTSNCIRAVISHPLDLHCPAITQTLFVP